MEDFRSLEFLDLAIDVASAIGFSDDMIHSVRLALIEYQNEIDTQDFHATVEFIRDLFEPIEV